MFKHKLMLSGFFFKRKIVLRELSHSQFVTSCGCIWILFSCGGVQNNIPLCCQVFLFLKRVIKIRINPYEQVNK